MCANISPTPPPSTPYRRPTLRRYARWLTATPAWCLQNGHRAGLAITIGEDTQCYWVERVVGGYQMMKERPDLQLEPPRTISLFTPSDVSTWSCSCPDYRYRVWRRGEKVSCKHVLALAAALKAAEGGAR